MVNEPVNRQPEGRELGFKVSTMPSEFLLRDMRDMRRALWMMEMKILRTH